MKLITSLIQTPLDKACFNIRTTLTGRDYVLQFDYHERQDRWFLHIRDVNGETIASGAKLITNWPLYIGRRWDPRMPAGALIPRAPGFMNAAPPGYYDLGRRVFLFYWENIP